MIGKFEKEGGGRDGSEGQLKGNTHINEGWAPFTYSEKRLQTGESLGLIDKPISTRIFFPPLSGRSNEKTNDTVKVLGPVGIPVRWTVS